MKKTFKRFIFLFVILGISRLSALTQDNFSNCTAKGCHLTQTRFSVVHSPLEDGCDNCHQTESDTHPVENEKEFSLITGVPELCYNCHETNNQMKHVHPPVKNGECLSCHNPHSSDYESLLIADGGETCASCHDLMKDGGEIHGPVAANMCNACHTAHQSDIAGLLLQGGMDLCLFCHTNKKDVQNMPSVHEPFKEACLQCHSPHRSTYKFMVRKDVPGLCFDCHDSVEVQVGQQSEVHGPFQKGGKCYLCHNAHVSEHANLLQDREEKLCFTCHNKKIKKDTHTVKDIEKRVAASKYVHAPIADDGCSACHAAHTPDNYFLLSAAFPKGSYGNGSVESFAHCFDCHDSALLQEKETTSATSFRNGNKNMHYLHVNREKARNCTTCHDIHGSKYPHLIAEKVPFGKWEMPMKFKITPDGGSCLTGCHKELSYSRK